MTENQILLLVVLGWLIPFFGVFAFFLIHRAVRIFLLRNGGALRARWNNFLRVSHE